MHAERAPEIRMSKRVKTANEDEVIDYKVVADQGPIQLCVFRTADDAVMYHAMQARKHLESVGTTTRVVDLTDGLSALEVIL